MAQEAVSCCGSGWTTYVGDCRQILPQLPTGSVQCCITSPPYWGLRDYEHPLQLGAESSPQQYVENLVQVFRLVWRVLREDGRVRLKFCCAIGQDMKNGLP